MKNGVSVISCYDMPNWARQTRRHIVLLQALTISGSLLRLGWLLQAFTELYNSLVLRDLSGMIKCFVFFFIDMHIVSLYIILNY